MVSHSFLLSVSGSSKQREPLTVPHTPNTTYGSGSQMEVYTTSNKGFISLLLLRLPKLSSKFYSKGLADLGNLGSNKEIEL